jgi:hypothetical protein
MMPGIGLVKIMISGAFLKMFSKVIMPGKQKVIQEIQVIRRATYNERHEKIIELIDWT